MRALQVLGLAAVVRTVIGGHLVLGLAGCGGSAHPSSTVEPAVSTTPEASAVDDDRVAAEAAASEGPPAATEGFSWEPLDGPAIERAIEDRWGVRVEVSDTARGRYESPYDRYVLTTPHCSDYCVTIARIPTVAPSLAAARARWESLTASDAPGSTTLEEGSSPEGVLCSIRRFTVRVGFPGIEGQTIHRLEQVARLFVVVPVDASSHLEFTGYVEHDVEAVDEPAVSAARDVCMSLRVVRPRP